LLTISLLSSQLICEAGIDFTSDGKLYLYSTSGSTLESAKNASAGTVLQPLVTNSTDTLHDNSTVQLGVEGMKRKEGKKKGRKKERRKKAGRGKEKGERSKK
jgi:hypothetical protein